MDYLYDHDTISSAEADSPFQDEPEENEPTNDTSSSLPPAIDPAKLAKKAFRVGTGYDWDKIPALKQKQLLNAISDYIASPDEMHSLSLFKQEASAAGLSPKEYKGVLDVLNKELADYNKQASDLQNTPEQ